MVCMLACASPHYQQVGDDATADGGVPDGGPGQPGDGDGDRINPGDGDGDGDATVPHPPDGNHEVSVSGSAAGGVMTSRRFRLRVSVAPARPLGESKSSRYRLKLGPKDAP
jgi:hypothetical protein